VAWCRSLRARVKLAAARAELVGSQASSSPRRRLSWAWRGARGSHGLSTSGSRRRPGVELLAPWVKLVAGDITHRTLSCALLPVPLHAASSPTAAPLLLALLRVRSRRNGTHVPPSRPILRATCHRDAAAVVGDGGSSWATANEAIPILLHCFHLFVFNVANVCFRCFERSRAMSKLFHVDVAK
jgi:hypothetical protein